MSASSEKGKLSLLDFNYTYCPYCRYPTLGGQSSVNRHIGQKHRDKATLSFYHCDLCGGSYKSKQTMLNHLRNMHDLPVITRKAQQVCPILDCKCKCISYREILDHILSTHNISVDVDELEFPSLVDFQTWFEDEKKRLSTSYVRKKSGPNSICYICHRSGSRKPRGKGKHCSKQLTKIGKCCPARLIVQEKEGGVFVKYFKTHLGHSNETSFLNLTKDEKAEIARRLQSGVTMDTILNEIREIYKGGRMEILDDLHNIIRDFKLKEKGPIL